ncbi:hypothetical protein DL93DRAFT_844155 [Clavulina sp. PMI_390]|nr:hypothetical protein DL93DRAFT_844155 [Clavulina sp. PMI_390]
MNQWFDAIPAHLKWDPNRQNEVHFVQSAVLSTLYHHAQILIHRPFLLPTKGPSTLSFPSLSILAHAARSCIHVLEVLQNHGIHVPPPVLGSANHSGIVLLMAIWTARKTGANVDYRAAMRDVKQCINFLRSCESRSQAARAMVDVLEDLANCGDLDLSHVPPSVKRGYPESQDNLPVPPEASNSRISDEFNRNPQSPMTQLLGVSPVLHQPDARALPLLSHPSVPPVGEPRMSPTTEFLQSYVASLPLHSLTTDSNPLLHDGPAPSSSISAVILGEGVPIPSVPISTDSSPPATAAAGGNGALEWDGLASLGLQASGGSTSSANGFASLEGGLFTNSPSTSSLSAEPLLRDAHLFGYEGFAGTLGFAAEAQAFLGSNPEGHPLVDAEDIDWSNILNLG